MKQVIVIAVNYEFIDFYADKRSFLENLISGIDTVLREWKNFFPNNSTFMTKQNV